MDYLTLNQIIRCNKIFSHTKIRNVDLSDTEFMICSYIYSNPGSSQDNVATALKTDKTTVGKALMSLETKHCIERVPDNADRRIKRIQLTDIGKDKISGIINIHNEWMSEILKCLSPEEQANFENYCERLLAAAESFSGKDAE